jgi:hypothetical protein
MTFVWITSPKMKLKKSSACIKEKRKVSNNSFSFPLIKLSGCLPKMMRKEGLMMAKSLMVKKKRNKRPKGPESFFDMEITFSSLRILLAMMML